MSTKYTTCTTNRSPGFAASNCTHCLAAGLALLGVALSLPHAAEAQGAQVLEGRMTQLTSKLVTIDGAYTYRFDPATAQCFDFRGSQTTCGTLVDIGYAHKARLTISGDAAIRIDLLELHQ